MGFSVIMIYRSASPFFILTFVRSIMIAAKKIQIDENGTNV